MHTYTLMFPYIMQSIQQQRLMLSNQERDKRKLCANDVIISTLMNLLRFTEKKHVNIRKYNDIKISLLYKTRLDT